MALDDLIDAASKLELTDADIAAMETRLEKAESGFVAEAEANRVTNEWLNCEYTI